MNLGEPVKTKNMTQYFDECEYFLLLVALVFLNILELYSFIVTMFRAHIFSSENAKLTPCVYLMGYFFLTYFFVSDLLQVRKHFGSQLAPG